MVNDLSTRLRSIRDKKGWTVADMAERTGIPKRSLDKYMLRTGASLPGFDALCALSRGLGVSLDWLIFGEDIAGKGVELFAERAAHHVVRLFGETLIRYHLEGKPAIIDTETILGLAPEEWASDLGMRAGEKAKELVAKVPRWKTFLRGSMEPPSELPNSCGIGLLPSRQPHRENSAVIGCGVWAKTPTPWQMPLLISLNIFRSAFTAHPRFTPVCRDYGQTN